MNIARNIRLRASTRGTLNIFFFLIFLLRLIQQSIFNNTYFFFTAITIFFLNLFLYCALPSTNHQPRMKLSKNIIAYVIFRGIYYILTRIARIHMFENNGCPHFYRIFIFGLQPRFVLSNTHTS